MGWEMDEGGRKAIGNNAEFFKDDMGCGAYV